MWIPEVMSVLFFQWSLGLVPVVPSLPLSPRQGHWQVLRRGETVTYMVFTGTTLFPRLPRKEGPRPEVCDVVRVRELYVALMFDKRLTVMCKISFVCNNR